MDIKLELINIEDLTLDPNNARKHNKKNLEAIAKSLQQFGQRKPIVITQDNVVVAGNGTLEAAKSIGCVRVPADWNEETIKAYALTDNRTAEMAAWDSTILLDQLRELDISGWNVNDLGFKDFDLKTKDEIETGLQDYAERYEVVIECADENEQTALLLRLSEEGLRVKAIVI
jgi:ParB-like chromosome segregation protein Spo0J